MKWARPSSEPLFLASHTISCRRTFLGNGSEGPKPEELMIKEEEEDNNNNNNNNNYTVISVSLISGADAF